MTRHRGSRTLAAKGSLLLLATLATGCGRGVLSGDAGAANLPGLSEPESTTAAVETTGSSATATPVAFPEAATAGPVATSTPDPVPTPTPAPLATPDLAVIEQLLDELDAALGADATADIDEGSAD